MAKLRSGVVLALCLHVMSAAQTFDIRNILGGMTGPKTFYIAARSSEPYPETLGENVIVAPNSVQKDQYDVFISIYTRKQGCISSSQPSLADFANNRLECRCGDRTVNITFLGGDKRTGYIIKAQTFVNGAEDQSKRFYAVASEDPFNYPVDLRIAHQIVKDESIPLRLLPVSRIFFRTCPAAKTYIPDVTQLQGLQGVNVAPLLGTSKRVYYVSSSSDLVSAGTRGKFVTFTPTQYQDYYDVAVTMYSADCCTTTRAMYYHNANKNRFEGTVRLVRGSRIQTNVYFLAGNQDGGVLFIQYLVNDQEEFDGSRFLVANAMNSAAPLSASLARSSLHALYNRDPDLNVIFRDFPVDKSLAPECPSAQSSGGASPRDEL